MVEKKLEYALNPFYKYQGRVERVIDGDTVDAKLDLGFGITMRQRFRIDSYDAPETWRPRNEAEKQHGEEAKKRAVELLSNQDLIFITSKTPGIYGRYGAQILLDDGRDFASVMISEGLEKKLDYS